MHLRSRRGTACALTLALLLDSHLSPSSASASADTLGVAEREDHSASLTIRPDGLPSIVWIASAPDTNGAGRFDELVLSERDSTGWSTPTIVASPGDYFTPSLVHAEDGAFWICWAEHEGTDSRIRVRRELDGDVDLYTLGDPAQPDLEPAICAGRQDSVVVVWQGWRNDNYEILMSLGDSAGFSVPQVISECGLSDREPVIAWGDDRAWIVWSSYRGNPYNLMLRTFDGTTLSTTVRITDSFRARNLHPRVAWDDANQVLWYGYHRVNFGWNGFNVGEPGTTDLGTPRLRATDGTTIYLPADLDAEQRFQLVDMEDVGYERYDFWGTPMPDRYGSGLTVISVPGDRIWCFYKLVGTLTDYDVPHRYWGAVGLNYGSAGWSDPAEFFSPRTALGWEVPVARACGETLWVAWSGDDRSTPICNPTGLNLFGHDLNVIVEAVPIDTTAGGTSQLLPNGGVLTPGVCELEPRPQFSVSDGGQTRWLFWGDNHRHSEDLSFDGHGDCMFKETIFYSLDFLGHDFIAPSDHAERFSKAVWTWVAKWAEIYDVPGRFRVFPCYERVMRGGAGGDQNVLYAQVSEFTEASAAYPAVASWHTMYAAQEELDVISVPHQLAQTGAVVDWEHLAAGNPDSLAAPLRVMEIYQSCRESFEYPGCPRQYSGSVCGPDSGWASVALAMGMRLGILAASDHTCQAGFAGVLAPECTRESIFESLYDRHCFGTSNAAKMGVEFRVADSLMGSEVECSVQPTLYVRIEASDPLEAIEINKDGNPTWFTASSINPDTTFSFTDTDPIVWGTSSFYYLRVTTEADDMAWTSPVWADFIPAVDVAQHADPTRSAEEVAICVAPNPSRGDVVLKLAGVAPAGGVVRVYDVVGRLVRQLVVRPGSSQRTLRWDGRNEAGSRVAAGKYFAVLHTARTSTKTGITNVR